MIFRLTKSGGARHRKSPRLRGNLSVENKKPDTRHPRSTKEHHERTETHPHQNPRGQTEKTNLRNALDVRLRPTFLADDHHLRPPGRLRLPPGTGHLHGQPRPGRRRDRSQLPENPPGGSHLRRSRHRTDLRKRRENADLLSSPPESDPTKSGQISTNRFCIPTGKPWPDTAPATCSTGSTETQDPSPTAYSPSCPTPSPPWSASEEHSSS